MNHSSTSISLILGLALTLSACAVSPVETQPSLTLLSPTPTADLVSQPTPSEENSEEPNSLPAQPLDVVFFSEDGFELHGRFYPAKFLGRPIVVLLHWYPGDQNEWQEIAYWLQNRGLSGTFRGVPWLDPSWFPALSSETSYNVLTFTFRECAGGCKDLLPQEWLKDAQAGLEAARSLQGADPEQLVVIGASIGGDAAIASCAASLTIDPQGCLGALSLSPGNYLGGSYSQLVKTLEEAPIPRAAWCLYDEADPDAGTCAEAEGTLYFSEGWQGGNLHGMHLLTSTLDPLPLQRLLDFIFQVTAN